MVSKQFLILLPANQIYGQERALISLAQIVRREGFDCHFLTHRGWGEKVAKDLEELNFKTTSLPLGSLWSLDLLRRNPASFLLNLQGVVRSSILFLWLIRKLRPHFLLTGNATFTFYLLPALLISRLRVIYRHGDEPATHSPFHRLLNGLLFARVDAHVANCRFLADRLASRHSIQVPTVIYNLPAFLLRDKCKTLDLVEEFDATAQINILFVGQIAYHKGVHLLLEAFTQLAADQPRISLALVGDIPGVGRAKDSNILLLDMMRSTKQSFPDQFFYLGYKEDPSTQYRLADVYVCPSIYQEPSANTIFEAKSFGLPSVVFDVGGLPELIEHKVDGYICDQISSGALAKGLNFFIEDNERRKQAGRESRRSIDSNFGVDRFKSQWLQVMTQFDV